MSTNTSKGPIIDPGLCRCCGIVKKCRLLNVEYEWCGKKEVYSDMFLDCFGLLLSHLDGQAEERLICASCVLRLRDATQFRKHVLQCEQIFLKSKIQAVPEDVKPKTELLIKEEMTDDDIADCHSNDDECVDEMKDPPDEIDAQIKEENKAINIPKPFVKRKLTNDNDYKAKKELILRMKRTREKLNKLKDRDKSERPLVTLVKKKSYVDKEYNAVNNAITIVECSYVCPFFTIYSDFYCIYCKEMFTNVDILRTHTLTHDPSTYKDVIDAKKNILVDIDRIDCRLCQENINDIDSLKSHLSNVHGKMIYKETNNEFLKFKLKNSKMSCTECGRTYSIFQSLKKHMAEHFGTYICDVCGAHYFEERLLNFHKKIHITEEEKDFTCTDCGKIFKSKKSRYFHIARIHKNEPAYPCNKCDQVFFSYHLRYKHKRDEHGEHRVFPCENCDKVYDNRKSLREHNRKSHLLLLKHECSQCERKFYLPSQLRDHMTSHTGERNFRCEYCGRSYPRLKALKVHMDSHNTEKRYKCELCSASYTQLNNYKNHMKSKHQPMENGNQFS